MRSIMPAIRELERGFDMFRPLFPDCDFPKPVIAIQSKGRKSALGWFAHEKWRNEATDAIPEITVTAEHLKAPVANIAEVLIHEMCHYANSLNGVRDCSSNQYHNKHYRTRAESVGLVVERGPRGWAYTTLGPDLATLVGRANLNAEAFSLFRLGVEVKKGEGKMKKWTCGCTNVRAAVEVEAVCQKCGRPFLQP